MARILFIGALLALLAAPPSSAAEVEVDVELVLAVDVSRSMDLRELLVQRQGYIAALRDPGVLRAIGEGMLGRIAVTYLEWAGSRAEAPLVDWMLIDSPAAADAFARKLEAAPLDGARGTSISNGLLRGAELIEQNGYAGLKRVIDVSGDGPNNAGPAVEAARDEVISRGVVINGLPVMLSAFDGPFSLENLDVYYEDCVIGGPAAFVLPVYKSEEFAETIRRKLILEIAGRAPLVWPAQFSRPAPRIDCMIGEKRRREWMIYQE